MFEQERMIGRIQRRVAIEQAIIACFLSGSYGRHTEDEYSDLDVALIFQDQTAMEQAWREREAFAQSFMPYVAMKSFDGDHVRPYFLIALFANGCKVDLRYETAGNLEPNPWDSQIRILKDSGEWAKNFQTESSGRPIPQAIMTLNNLVTLDQRFWVMYWDIFRQLKRGNTDKPFEIYLQLLYFHLPPLLNCLPDDHPAKTRLFKASYGHDAQVNLKGFVELLQSYLGAREVIVKRFHLDFRPNRAFESEIQGLVSKLS